MGGESVQTNHWQAWWSRLKRVGVATVGLCVALSVGLPESWAGEPPAEQLDCKVYETRKMSVTVGFSVGNMVFSMGPDVTLGIERGVAWDKAAQGLIARYVELCTRYNTGMVTPEEYHVRLKEIDGLYKEAREIEAKLFEATRQRARGAMDELQQSLGQKPTMPQTEASSLQTSVDNLVKKVEALSPIGRPLTPAPPCPAPDMLGAPGAHAEPRQPC